MMKAAKQPETLTISKGEIITLVTETHVLTLKVDKVRLLPKAVDSAASRRLETILQDGIERNGLK
jgi:hypothetical protein